MNLGLKDKSVIVMASSSGLGKAIACEFAREHAKVMLFSSSESKLLQAQADIMAKTGYEPEYYVGDITDGENIKRASSDHNRQVRKYLCVGQQHRGTTCRCI